DIATVNGRWQPTALVLAPIEVPCAVCRSSEAPHQVTMTDDAATMNVCRRCHEDHQLGKALLNSVWMELFPKSLRKCDGDTFSLHATTMRLHRHLPASCDESVFLCL